MPDDMSQLVKEIEAILSAKQALVTAGIITEAEYTEMKKAQMARIDAAAATAEVVIVKPAPAREPVPVPARPPSRIRTAAATQVLSPGERQYRSETIILARDRLRNWCDRVMVPAKSIQGTEKYEDYLEGIKPTLINILGIDRWRSFICITATNRMEWIEPIINEEIPEPYQDEMRRYKEMRRRRKELCDRLERKCNKLKKESGDLAQEIGFDVLEPNASVHDLISQNPALYKYKGLRSVLARRRMDVTDRIMQLDKLLKKVGGPEKAAVEYERELYAEENVVLTRRIKQMNSSAARADRYFRECVTFLDSVEMKGYRLEDVGPERFARSIDLINANRAKLGEVPYSGETKNTYIKRNRTFINRSLGSRELGELMPLENTLQALMPVGAILGVTTSTHVSGTGKRPPNAFKLIIKGNKNDPSGYAIQYSEVSDVYKFLHTTRYPKLYSPTSTKKVDLMEICLRLLRETGLRPSHAMYFRWSDLPMDMDDMKESRWHYRVKYDSVVRGIGKELSSINYISTLLVKQIIAYRKAYPPETLDDYRVFNIQTLLGRGNPLLPMIEGSNHVFDVCCDWIRRDSARRARAYWEDVTPSKRKRAAEGRGHKVGKMLGAEILDRLIEDDLINLTADRFRDSYMTLMLKVMSTDETDFKDVTGDDRGTAADHYRDVSKVEAPETRIAYTDIVRLVFNNE